MPSSPGRAISIARHHEGTTHAAEFAGGQTAMSERVVWLIYSRGLQYRRTKHGRATPALREDEHAYRVVLPAGTPADRHIVTLKPEAVTP